MEIELTPNGTYGVTMPNVPRPLRKIMFGRGSTFMKLSGAHILTLTTTGAKSGKDHQVALGWFPDGENAWLIVASAAGAAKNPAWYYNMARNPDKIWIDLDKRKIHVQAESLSGAAYDKSWNQVVTTSPNYGTYTEKTDRHIPVIRLTPKL